MFSIKSYFFASSKVTQAWSVSSSFWSLMFPESRSAVIEIIIVEYPFGRMSARLEM